MDFISSVLKPEVIVVAFVVMLLAYFSFTNYKFHEKENKKKQASAKKESMVEAESKPKQKESKAVQKLEEKKHGLKIAGKRDEDGNIEVKSVIEKRGEEGLLEIPIKNEHDLKLSPSMDDNDDDLRVEILGDDDDGITADLRRMMFENSLNEKIKEEDE